MNDYKYIRRPILIFLVPLLLIAVVNNVSAVHIAQVESGAQVIASEDAYIYKSFPNDIHDGFALTLEYQSVSEDIRIALVKFPNINMSNPIEQARLNIYGTDCDDLLPFDPGQRIDIYAVFNDTWSEESVTWNNFNVPDDINRGEFLMSIDGGVAIAETYNYWTDTTNGALAQFVESQNLGTGGDGTVSLWLEIGNTIPAIVTFMDIDDASGGCGTAGNHPPILQYADSAGPLAITLTSLTAESNNTGNWLGWLVLVLAFLGLIGVFVWRRRIHHVEG